MNKKEKIFLTITSLLVYTAIFIFFAFKYGFHVIYQEQLQLFENTPEYFIGTVLLPGGAVDYISRFLTQFFFYSWSGSLIIASTLLAIQLLVVRLSGRNTLLSHSLSIIPVALLSAMLCHRFAPINSAIAILMCLGSLAALLQIQGKRVRTTLILISIPVLYFLAGPAVILIPLISISKERKVWFAISSIALTALCPIIAYTFLNFNFSRLLWGINYYKMHYDIPVWPWIAISGTLATVLISEFISNNRSSVAGISSMIAIIAGGTILMASTYNAPEERELMYQILTVKRAWPSIVSVSTKEAPDTYNDMACINMALCQTGHMGGHMFDYPQAGTEGLIPNTSPSQHDRLFIGEIYYQLGLINNARRYCMEALAYIPDYQYSAPIFAILAEINIVDGHFTMARSYLRTLTHTIFYRKWAENLLSRFDEFENPEAVNEYSVKRFSPSKSDSDFFFDYKDIGQNLLQLVAQRPDNITALNYLLALNLLDKDLTLFTIHCPFNGYVSAVPKAYQEAFIQDWTNHNWEIEELPEFIDPGIVSRMVSFKNDYDSGQPMDFMLKKYRNTYWTYYCFR